MKINIDAFKLHPTQILVLGFLGVITLGTMLLMLPVASRSGLSIGFVDALFTATSAVCVTGLVVVNTMEHWTMFGKLVILLLIQIGGLGFMTITTTFFILLGKKIRLKERLVIQESLGQTSISGMVKLVVNILLGTLIFEGIGAVLLSIKFVPEYGAYGIFMGIFHSVSAFCNAGFDIIGQESLIPYRGDILVNFAVMSLIILGGLGFSVWMDLVRVTKDRYRKRYTWRRWFRQLSLHTKLVLSISLGLILSGAVFFLVAEGWNPNTLGGLGAKDKFLGALFQSVTARTAGFNTMPLDVMTNGSKFVTIILMFIGGSPGGTTGGVKTVTMGVLLLSMLSVVQGKEELVAFKRRIPDTTIKRALAVVMISLFMVIAVTLALSMTEETSFINIFFETVSAFATVGLTLGITLDLETASKLLLSFTMFAGRLGPVTLAVAFSLRGTHKSSIHMPEEKIMVG
ncbi:TrkH family potassium uptake protein [Anaerotalea alkaliphila]|uniref:Trk family potassium uptake protein n=1 Tax=Anaerotalea alkaliphila TaxID=2662126 RepID=A0A7X5HVZ0_9FIRM|nr:TrkH family potassium uptake protein [Anaerotalea alkaliphila]NDL67670.1 Trk family potassium uptake protein [Anaerotalea alkaliphila]